MNILIDANIAGRLDNEADEVGKRFSDLQRICQEHGVEIFVQPGGAVRRVEGRPRKVALGSFSFSQLASASIPSEDDLALVHGQLAGPTEVRAATMLHAVSESDVDILITEDDALHRMAGGSGLGGQVLTVADALVWLRRMFEPEQVFLPTVQSIKADEVDFEDPIFVTLGGDYHEFTIWAEKCKRQQRDCWVVMDDDAIAGIVIRKDETHADAQTLNTGPAILKICTFKVAEDHQGFKIGEQLLKQALWYAQRNGYDLTYLTVFPRQEALIRLIEEYGFVRTKGLSNGEQVYEKVVKHGPLTPAARQTMLEAVRANYPRFGDGPTVRKFVVPIEQPYHAKLFPEVTAPATGTPGIVGGKPGNTIRKVYICHAPSNQLRPGDLLFFYMMKKRGSYGSQSLTSVGVVESVRSTYDVNDVRRWTARRSVFSDAELSGWVSGPRALKVIDFLLIGHLEPTIPLSQMMSENVLRGWPQSITQLYAPAYARLKPMLNLGFEF